MYSVHHFTKNRLLSRIFDPKSKRNDRKLKEHGITRNVIQCVLQKILKIHGVRVYTKFIWLRLASSDNFCEHSNEPLCSVIKVEYLEELSDC
jgi:hypothetical protein